MKIKYSYVDWIQDFQITVYCVDDKKIKFLKSIHAKRKFFNRKYWIISYDNDYNLAKLLTLLRNENFMFSYDEHGWSPSGIFQHLREKGLLCGKLKEISWKKEDDVCIREL